MVMKYEKFWWSETRTHFRMKMLFPLFCRNEIRWKTPKLCLNVLKSWHFDPSWIKGMGVLLPFRSRHLGHHSLARHLLPIYCCYAQNILHFLNSLRTRCCRRRRLRYAIQAGVNNKSKQLNYNHNENNW